MLRTATLVITALLTTTGCATTCSPECLKKCPMVDFQFVPKISKKKVPKVKNVWTLDVEPEIPQEVLTYLGITDASPEADILREIGKRIDTMEGIPNLPEAVKKMGVDKATQDFREFVEWLVIDAMHDHKHRGQKCTEENDLPKHQQKKNIAEKCAALHKYKKKAFLSCIETQFNKYVVNFGNMSILMFKEYDPNRRLGCRRTEKK